MNLDKLLEENRGGILSLAKKYGIIGMDITGSYTGGIAFLVEFAPAASPDTHKKLQQDLLALLGHYVELESAEEINGHKRRIVIKEAVHN